MIKLRILLPLVLLTVISVHALSKSHIYRYLRWNIQRPDVYYVEITDVRHGETYHRRAVVFDDQMIHTEPESNEYDLSVFTVEQLFSLVDQACGFLQTDCIIVYDDEYHYISELAVFDWRVLRVEKFEVLSSSDITYQRE